MDVKSIRVFLSAYLKGKPYLYITIALILIIPILSVAATTARHQQTITSTSPPTQANTLAAQFNSQPPILTNIKALMQQHQLDKAKALALDYLKSSPDDVDVILLLGFIYYQQSAYQQAEQSFRQVLQKSPNYLDAKIGLARVLIVEKKYKEASDLINASKKAEPNNPEVKQIQAFYQKVISAHSEKQKPHKTEKNEKEQPNCIDIEMAENVNHALRMINAGLMLHPNDKRLLTQKAEVNYKKHLYAQSAYYAQAALEIDPTYAPAKDVLSRVNEISPNKLFGLNEIGLSSLNEYVSDLHQNWDYSTLYLMRETGLGNLSARVNYAQRIGSRSFQGEFEFVPIINPYFNLDLYYGVSDNPNLFPKNAFAVEGYGTLPNYFTLSLGEYYAHILGSIGYKKTTSSLSKDIGHNWLLFRVNHYVPNSGAHSTLYIATARHYFNSNDFFLGVTIGYGRSPDLADLLDSNFLIIRNKFINVNLRFPIYCNRILVDIGADHQKWKYPSGLDRPLTGATVGLSYRF